MKASFTVKVVMTIDHKPGDTKPTVAQIDFNIDRISNNLNPRPYLSKGLPTAEGSKIITNAFTQGLIANIHACHEHGFRDSAEHLRYIIDNLQRGFVSQVEVTDGTFDDGGK
jgi:hypothetical protein